MAVDKEPPKAIRGDPNHPGLKNLVSIKDSEMAEEWRCLLYTSPSPRDRTRSRMPSSA